MDRHSIQLQSNSRSISADCELADTPFHCAALIAVVFLNREEAILLETWQI